MLRTINSKYFQHFDLLRGFLSLGLGFITGKVSGLVSILTFGSRSRNVKQGSCSLAKSRIDHSIPLDINMIMETGRYGSKSGDSWINRES